jgi:uncharacterized RDD family membrane protein YckC
MSQWYYTRNQQQMPTPVTWETLQGLAANGTLTAQEMVWQEGMAEWAPAASVPGLLPAVAAASPYAQSPYSQPMGAGPTPLAYMSNPAGGVQYANFGQRLLAWLIDYLVNLGIGFVVGLVIGVIFAAAKAGDTAGLVAGLIGWVISWLYYALQESSAAQATLGKRALSLTVTDMQGNRISFGRATGRFFVKLLSGLTLGIGFLMVAFTERRQGLHDMVASTLVLKRS